VGDVGPKSPFRSEVYFVSTRLQHGLGWGTSQPILFRDSELHVIRLRAHGTYSMRVVDPTIFLNRMVGTQGLFTSAQIEDYLRSILTARLVDVFGGVVKSVFDMPQQYDEVSSALKARARSDFEAAGLELVDFLIEAVTPPEEVAKMVDERSGMAAVGDMNTFIKFKAAKSLQDAAQHGGAGSLVGAGAGLGLGMMMPQVLQQAMQQGQPPPLAAQSASLPTPADPYELLTKLKGLLDGGAITQDEYDAKKKELLARM
jgi:membrane protease subunit (stomatin/prohibitin family)